jgi:hypothetical protein
LDAPHQALARQQAPEGVDIAVLPVAGHGAGLRPELLNSVEPIGIVGTPSCDVAGGEVLDCEAVGLPAAEAGPHAVVAGAADPGRVAPVMIPTPLLSNGAVAPDVPVTVPGLEHAVAEATPFVMPELTPGDGNGLAPRGIPVGATDVPDVLMPNGEVVPIPALGVPMPPTCAYAQLVVTKIAVAITIKRRVIAVSRTSRGFGGTRSASSRSSCEKLP